jgi:phage-related protein
MNEIKILITAANSAAKKAVKEVREEIEKTSQSAKKNGKSISDSMRSIAKGAAVAVGAVTAVTTALVAFGKSTIEAQKNLSKLNAAFLAAGSTTKQAGETYKNLYRFMGDSGAATEAAQSLALITTNEKDLVEWTKILQGVYATMGSTLPIESLAEAANETIKVGVVTGTFADALNWAGVSEDAFNAKLAQTASLSEREALVRSTLNSLYMNAANIYERNNKALLANAESQAKLDLALAQAGRAILPLMTAVNNLATTLLTVLRPAFEAVADIIAVFVSYIVVAIQWVSAFFSLFSLGGDKAKDTTKEVANNINKAGAGAQYAAGSVGGLGGALNKAASAAKELKKQTMGFDELNIVQSQDASSSAGGGAGGAAGGGGGISLPDMSELTNFEVPGLDDFKEKIEKAKQSLTAILILLGSIALAFAIFNFPAIASAVKGFDLLSSRLRFILGDLMAIAGAIMLVIGYSDAWVNGLDWGNFALILSGVALLIGGLGLAFGGIIASITAVGVGIALVVLGLKDFWTNGASVQNVLTILIGLIAVFAGGWYAASAAVGGGLAVILGGVVLLVAGIKDLVDNGFSWEAMLTIVTGVILVCVGAVLAFNAALLANPITWIVIAIAALVAAIVVCITHWDEVKEAAQNAWDWIKEKWGILADWFSEKVIEPIKNFFTELWTKITEIFGKVKEWFSEKFQQAWEGIKVVFSPFIDYFKMKWENVKLIFSVVKDVLTGNFSDAWEGIKKIFSNIGEFFSGVWDKVKKIFSNAGGAIGEAVSSTFKKAINWVLEKAIGIINGFISAINAAIGIINKIPGVEITKISKLDVPKLARGGIVDSATIAMIGERGKEAVVPLENNTEWMDKLADRIAARSNNPTKLILKVGEKELGWATIGAINGITEQTGGLQLVL